MNISLCCIQKDKERLLALKKKLEDEYEQLLLMKETLLKFEIPLLGNPLVTAINQSIALLYKLEFQLANYNYYISERNRVVATLGFSGYFSKLKSGTQNLHQEYEAFFKESLQNVIQPLV